MFKKIQRPGNQLNKQSFAIASLYYILASVIGQGVVLLSSGLFTRVMSKDDYGMVSTYSAWVLILNCFICLNLFITVRNAYIDYKEDYDAFNSSITCLCLLSGIAFTGVAVVVGRVLYDTDVMYQVALACMQAVAVNLINVKLAVQSMKNEYRFRALLLFLPNCFHILLSIALIYLYRSDMYMAKIIGNAGGLLLFGILACITIFRRRRPRIHMEYWKYALTISVPAIFHTLSDLLLMQSDRLMITFLVGADETAEYAIIYNVSSIIVILYQAINGAWVPWFYRKVSEGEAEESRKYHGIYMAVFFWMTCGVVTVSPELIKIISPKNYWNGMQYLTWIVYASFLIFLYAFFSNYLIYQKRTKRIAVNTGIAAVCNILLNYVLIARFGAAGAALATLISYMLLFALQLVAVEKEARRFFALKKMWQILGALAAYLVVFTFVQPLWPARYLLFILFCVAMYLFYGKALLHSVTSKDIIK